MVASYQDSFAVLFGQEFHRRIFLRKAGERNRKSIKIRMVKTEAENLDRPCSFAIENLNSIHL